MGDATLRKIFCRQETLRGGSKVKESVLQPDRDLFLPSPLPLQANKTIQYTLIQIRQADIFFLPCALKTVDQTSYKLKTTYIFAKAKAHKQ